MVLNVRKVRGRVLVAYAVDAEMPGFKDNRTQVRVIAPLIISGLWSWNGWCFKTCKE